MRRVGAIIAVGMLGVWASSALYTVDTGEYAYVTRFGSPIAILNGATDAGLHVKFPWPIDRVLSVDRRVQIFDLPAVETLTRDPLGRTVDKTIVLDAFVTWRVPDPAAVDRFLRSVGTVDQARKVLGPRINGRLAAVLSTLPLDDLVSVVDGSTPLAAVVGGAAEVAPPRLIDDFNQALIEQRAYRLQQRILGEDDANAADQLRPRVLDDYGIEVLQIRLRRFGYPETVRASIAERIRSERARKVAEYDSQGRQRSAEILADAERQARLIEAQARQQKTLIEEQAKKDAFDILNAAHAQDREFYVFLETLKAYQTMLSKTQDVLLLSTRHPLFELLLRPPMSPVGGNPSERNGSDPPPPMTPR